MRWMFCIAAKIWSELSRKKRHFGAFCWIQVFLSLSIMKYRYIIWINLLHSMVKKVQTIKINVLIILFFNGLIFKCYLGKPRKKSSSLNGRAIKRGGEVKGRAIKKKELFSNVPKFQRPLSSRGGGRLGDGTRWDVWI